MLINVENELNQAIQPPIPNITVDNPQMTTEVHYSDNNPTTTGTYIQTPRVIGKSDSGMAQLGMGVHTTSVVANPMATENLGTTQLGMGGHTTSVVEDGMSQHVAAHEAGLVNPSYTQGCEIVYATPLMGHSGGESIHFLEVFDSPPECPIRGCGVEDFRPVVMVHIEASTRWVIVCQVLHKWARLAVEI